MTTSQGRLESAQENSIPCLEGNPQLEARFECPICLQCLSEPVLTKCGHRFCTTCILVWLRREGGCPIDSQPLNVETDLFADNFTRREIQELEPHNANCSHSMSLLHNKEEAELPKECISREIDSVAVSSKPTTHHNHIESHLVNGHFNSPEQRMEAKALEATSLWTPDAKRASQEDATQQWQPLVRSLYERIVVLEQQNREQDIHVENLKRQLSTQMEQISQDLVLRYCMGTYVWVLPQFSTKLMAMRADPKRCMFYSPGFYTSPSGYRFCTRLNLSPNDQGYLSLLIHLMQGDNDPYLNWPFTGRISFMLINETHSQHMCDTMMSRPELEAFRRPTRDKNLRGFGYTEFVSLLNLASQGFVRDDKLAIKIKVQSV